MVEDSDAVLEFVISALEDLGYRVLSARNGLEALRVLESEEKIALLFTDIVLPGGMTGRELADAMKCLGTFMAALAVTTPSHFRPSPTHTASSRAELASPQRQWGHRATAPSVSIPPGLHSG